METSGIEEGWGENQPRPRIGQVKEAHRMSRSRLRSVIRAELGMEAEVFTFSFILLFSLSFLL